MIQYTLIITYDKLIAMGTKDSCNLRQRSYLCRLLLTFSLDACRWDRMVAMGNVVLLDNVREMSSFDWLAELLVDKYWN